MALAYRPPGISVTEVSSTSISPLLATPAAICIIGLSQGYQQRTDQFVLSGTSAVPLPGLPAGATVQNIVSVKDALNPSKGAADGSGYVVTTDYTVSLANGTITRVGAGGITSGTVVNVTYQYTEANYFDAIHMFDQGSVEQRFGAALDPTGTTINSPLSYATSIAFANGASDIICQPLFARATPGDPTTAQVQPNAAANANPITWADTLFVLRDIQDINVLIPIVGQSQTSVTDAAQLSIEQTFQDHLYFMAGQNQYLIAIFGEDSSTDKTKATQATLQSHATTLRGRYGGVVSEQIVLLSPSRFSRPLPTFGQSITIGGQYVAAGISGMIASRNISDSLTRKAVSGIVGVPDSRTLQQKNDDAAAGLMVIEQNGLVVQVRHSITIDNSATQHRELSVVRAKHFMIESVRQTLDTQIIGNLIADANAPTVVQAAVIGVLEQLRQGRDLVDYSGVTARLLSLDPTTIQVKFSYRPAFPLNYVDIQFSLDLTAQTTTFVGPDSTIAT